MPALDLFQSVPQDYGHEEEGTAPSEDNEGGIEVPPLRIELMNDQISELQTNINPLENSDDYSGGSRGDSMGSNEPPFLTV